MCFQQLLHEEAVLPTVPISNTDHVCVGKAVFRTLDCGDILQFIHKLEHVGLLLFVGTADRASSNLKFFKIWRALCGLARHSAVQLVPEACALHQIQRANISLLDRTRVYKSVKKTLSLLRLRRSRRAYEEKVLDEFASTLKFNGVPVSERQRELNEKINKAFAFVFTHHASIARYMLNEDDEEVQEHQRAKRRRDYAIHEHRGSFLNNGSVLDTCAARIDTAKNKDETITRGKYLINDMMFTTAPLAYNESRRLQYMEGTEWHALSALICGHGFGAWAKVQLQCESKPGSAASQHEENKRQEAGENLKAVRIFSKGAFSRFYIFLGYAILKMNELFVKVLLASSGVRIVSNHKARGANSSKKKDQQLQAQHRLSKIKTSAVMNAVEDHLHRMWQVVADCDLDILD